MPISARNCNDIGPFSAVKTNIDLDLSGTSDTYLRWKNGYEGPRIIPGGQAGTWSFRVSQFTVGVSRYPLYARHAVWMLANDQPIPVGKDVTFADSDPRNMHPSNLVLIDKRVAVQAANTKTATGASDAHAYAASMPNDCIIDTPNGIWRLVARVGKKEFVLGTTATLDDIVQMVVRSAICFGYSRDLPQTLDPALLQIVTQACDHTFKPTRKAENLTPSMKKRQDDYIAAVRQQVTAHRAHQTLKADLPAQGEPNGQASD